jgi:agmatinase
MQIMGSMDLLLAKLSPGYVALLGLPDDQNSSYLRGSAEAPEAIRQALHCGSSNLSTEDGGDLGSETRFIDLGDVQHTEVTSYRSSIESAITAILARGANVLSLGGDHAVSYPVLRAYATHFGPLDVIHLDAHPDLYDELDGNRYSHACPFARALEDGCIHRLVQIGIRTMNSAQRSQAKKNGVEVIDADNWTSTLPEGILHPLYISIDMDVLDPAFAPGVSHHEPGGLSTRDVIRLIHNVPVRPVGADLVELNPSRDGSGMSSMVAAKLVKELAAAMLHG